MSSRAAVSMVLLILIVLVPAFLICSRIFRVNRALRPSRRTVHARILSRRMETDTHHLTDGGKPASERILAPTLYYASFLPDSEASVELSVPAELYSHLTPGLCGNLTFRSGTMIRFVPDRP